MMRRTKMMRISKDEYYLGIALAVSKRSTCLKRHYGCVIVKDDIIIATGYNGSVRGEENCCDRGTCKRENAERYTGYESCDSVHAEQNALIATSRERLIGSTAYLACETFGKDEKKSDLWDEEIIGFYEDINPVPCGICERMLKNAGVIKVVNRRCEICL
jgi:dCMP deaminase